MPGPKMGPRPKDFNEAVIKQSPTYVKWSQLRTGEKLRYACREFVKGHGEDDERLMRRIMIARRNNIRDHETLKSARKMVMQRQAPPPPSQTLPLPEATLSPPAPLQRQPPPPLWQPLLQTVKDPPGRPLQLPPSKIEQVQGSNVEQAGGEGEAAVGAPATELLQSSSKQQADSASAMVATATAAFVQPPATLPPPSQQLEVQPQPQKQEQPIQPSPDQVLALALTDSQVRDEMDIPSVEATRSYRAWSELEPGNEFVYNQRYVKGQEGHDWLLRKNIWRRMRYRRENKRLVAKLLANRSTTHPAPLAYHGGQQSSSAASTTTAEAASTTPNFVVQPNQPQTTDLPSNSSQDEHSLQHPQQPQLPVLPPLQATTATATSALDPPSDARNATPASTDTTAAGMDPPSTTGAATTTTTTDAALQQAAAAAAILEQHAQQHNSETSTVLMDPAAVEAAVAAAESFRRSSQEDGVVNEAVRMPPATEKTVGQEEQKHDDGGGGRLDAHDSPPLTVSMSTETMTDDAVQAPQQHAQDPGDPEMLQQTMPPGLVVEQSQPQTPQQPAPSAVVVPQLDHSVAPMVKPPTQATQLAPSLLVGALQPQLPPQPLMVMVHGSSTSRCLGSTVGGSFGLSDTIRCRRRCNHNHHKCHVGR